MPKRTDLKKIMVIGSGPIVIGQAAEFDYAGTQACLSLREEGYEVVLCNSNPATIMTDTSVADKVYMEPLTLSYVAKIVRYERPDAIIPGLGGQTGLNLALQLEKKGVLRECGVELLGTRAESIERAEDRELFRALCREIGEPVLPSEIVRNEQEGRAAAEKIGFPLVLRPAFTLGGTGGGFADNEAEYGELLARALALSPVHEVLVEKSVKGFKEIEYEVLRDAADTAITVCNMENLDPVGVHTGDSIVVCPSQTLTNREYQMLRNSALRIIRALEIEGGCNVQFALDPNSFDYYVIEVNPRVSRSSALASKASGYPIARVSAKIAVGLTLSEIMLPNTPASFEPALDYIVTKMPRFPFDKFDGISNRLTTQMKATGEVMSVGRTFEESLLKAVRSLETGAYHLFSAKAAGMSREALLDYIREATDDRIFMLCELLRRGETPEKLSTLTGIDRFFTEKLRHITGLEKKLAGNALSPALLREAKQHGFSDRAVADLTGLSESAVRESREEAGILPVYKAIDTCASEFDAYIPYYYSTYNGVENEAGGESRGRGKIVVLGAGPIRIGQGVEFDYSTVHAVKTIREAGFEAIVINNNPETVSTDYTTSDKLYFEPLAVEDVMNVIRLEQPLGVIATLGGQTAVNLAEPLAARGVKIIGTDCAAIERAENRDAFEKLLEELEIPEPQGRAVCSMEAGVAAAREIGYPVLARPSFVLGGRAMRIIPDEAELRGYLSGGVEMSAGRPVLIDRYMSGKEVEVDAICDGTDVFVPGIMELVERTGIHSGDSISVYPPFGLSDRVKGMILQYTKRLGKAIGIVGLFNIQFIVTQKEEVFVIEVNPRSSRTVPFLSKATGYALPDIATRVMLGLSLKEQGIFALYPDEKKRYYVKAPVFSFCKLAGADASLSPEMKSTGEAIGYDDRLNRALFKALQASGMELHNYGTVFVTVSDRDKEEALPLIRRFYHLGFNIEATAGTAAFLKANGIRTRVLRKLSDGSDDIERSLRQGHISYVVNTGEPGHSRTDGDGRRIRQIATENNITMFTALDTVRVLLDVLEETTLGVSTINS